MKLSVVICTWNRAALLARTLRSLGAIRPPRCPWELLVVNNACSDETDRVVDDFASLLPLRRVFEPEPGLSNARNAAIRSATGEYVVWTDDDVAIDRDWLVAYEDAVTRWPEHAVFGGPIRPWFEGEPPQWLREIWEEVRDAFAIRDLGLQPILLDCAANIPYGTNYVVRMSEQRQFPYDPRLGRNRDAGLLGEETTAVRAIFAAGHSGRWVPGAMVDHWIPKARQTRAYLRKYYGQLGRTFFRDVDAAPRLLGRPRWVIRKLVEEECAYQLARLSGDPKRWVKPFIDASMLRGIASGSTVAAAPHGQSAPARPANTP
jgi:hypothetical protein